MSSDDGFRFYWSTRIFVLGLLLLAFVGLYFELDRANVWDDWRPSLEGLTFVRG